MRRTGTLGAALILALGALGATSGADPAPEDLRYDLSLPAGHPVAYTIDFEVAYPGPMELVGEWSDSRVLSLRLEELGVGAPPLRRSGPSPQRLAIDVQNPGAVPRQYRLSVRGLASRADASGTLVVRRPGAPPPPPLLEAQPPSEPPKVPEFVLPPDAPDSWRRFSEALDRFGDAIERDPRGDSCRWQTGLAAYLASRRKALLAGSAHAAPETVEALAGIVGMVRRVEELRTSTDPQVVGPPPEGIRQRERWSRIRDSRIRPVEAELDSLLAAIERGHAPELDEDPWAYRLVSCVIGCQRHFEERVRTGEARAVNLDLARAQWARLLEAADLLNRLTRLPEKPGWDEIGRRGSITVEPLADRPR